ncbi:hypothetical protein ABW21_db0200943 [Orbilia brochopaga]|nr:hypothetical protein ABW21_db0200943 [Drechslerella brochopaga]
MSPNLSLAEHAPCELCHRANHKTENCRSGRPPRPICSICHRNNHDESQCYYKDEKDPSKIFKRSECSNCGRWGHVKNTCWQLEENRDRRPGGFKPGIPIKRQASGPFVLPPRPGSVPAENKEHIQSHNPTQTQKGHLAEADPIADCDWQPQSGYETDLIDFSELSSAHSSPILKNVKSDLLIPSADEKSIHPDPDSSTNGVDPLNETNVSTKPGIEKFEKETQEQIRTSPPQRLGMTLVSSGETSQQPPAGILEKPQKSVSFSMVTWETGKSRRKSVALINESPMADMKEKDTASMNMPGYSDATTICGNGKESSLQGVKTSGPLGWHKMTQLEKVPASDESSTNTGSSAESHWDFRQAWAASLDYQHHISSNYEDFEQLEELEKAVSVRMRNGNTLVATRGGISRPAIWVGEKLRRLKLVNVLYIPEFEGKVMSVSAMMKWGYEVSMSAGCIDFYGNGNLKAQALDFGDRFIFTSEIEVQEAKKKFKADRLDGLIRRNKAKQETSIDLW